MSSGFPLKLPEDVREKLEGTVVEPPDPDYKAEPEPAGELEGE